MVLNMGTVSLLGGSSIESSSQGLGQGGNVTIQGFEGTGSAAESVTLSGDSFLSSATAGSGAGGRVAITSKSLTMEGAATTVKSETTGVGRGGDIVVNVQHASLSDGATIKTLTFSNEDNAPAGGSVTVQGLQGAGSMADSVALSGLGSGIVSDAQGAGTISAGDVTVHAKTIRLADGAVIQAGTLDTTGAGGNVTIVADSIDISGRSSISSQARGADAGRTHITANRLLLNNASIASNTTSSGRGGDVVLNVGTMSLSNGATINSSTSETGRAGDITMNVGSLTLANHSEITSSSTGRIEIEAGAGDAGNITVQSRSTVVLDNSSITTEAIEASGGQITINAPHMVQLVNSRVSTSVQDGTGGGGNISIDPDFVILKGSQILAQAFAGSGGAINVTAGLFLTDPASVVDASSTLGVSGTVQINAPINNLSSVVARLPESLLAVQALLRASCAAKLAQGATSSFVERGRDGIPAGPDGLLASPYLPITSGRSTQLQTKPLIGKSGIQLRRLFGKEIPSSLTLISEHTTCSS